MDIELMVKYVEGLYEFHLKDDDVNMIKYIREYKHIIGCEYVCSWFNTLDGAKTWFFTEDKLEDFDIMYKPIKFITHDDRLVSYEEYMNLYYLEYKYVWEKQICK